MSGRELLGHRIRTIRKDQKITQSELAKSAQISAAYLNLIKHNRRPIGGALLLRFAEALNVHPSDLTGSEESRLLADLQEISADPILAHIAIEREEMTRLLGIAPDSAKAFVSIYRAYKAMSEQVDALSERVSHDPILAHAAHDVVSRITSIRSFAEILRDHEQIPEVQRHKFTDSLATETSRLSDIASEMFTFLNSFEGTKQSVSPADEVDDLLYDFGNYFEDLEQIAQTLRPKIETDRGQGVFFADIIHYLKRRHHIQIQRVLPGQLGEKSKYWDEENRCLYISKSLPITTSRFEVAKLVGRLEAKETVEKITSSSRLTTVTAQQRAAESLYSYFAGALIFPYHSFMETAKDLRYDIEQIQQLYAASWEQVCHRLTTLRQPGAEGIPFHFIRSDIAGNISKRFSASGLQIPRYGSICPRWVLHNAFLTPNMVASQLVQTPDKSKYLFIARTVQKPSQGYQNPRTVYSIMIGCDATYAPQLVYADNMAKEKTHDFTTVGLTCRQCALKNCPQRAFEYIDSPL